MATVERPGPVFLPPKLTWAWTKPKKPGKTVQRYHRKEESISYEISTEATEATVGLEVV